MANSSRPVKSLFPGKIQENYADLAAKGGKSLGFPTIRQLVTPKFPTHENREIFR